ncbi:hypothetical protein TIFTF001_042233, partial [Ficus carica]
MNVKVYVCMASKLPRVVPIRARSGLVHDLGTQSKVFLPSSFTVLPPAPQFYKDMNLVLNPGWTEDEEDRKALLAFRGMEEELHIFDKTQGMVARYRDSIQILSCRDVSSRYDCQPMPSQGGSCSCKVPWHRLGVLIQMSLEAMIASRSELRSESVENKLSLRYDMMR